MNEQIQLEAILEGLLFVVGEDGLTLDQIKDILEVDDETAKSLVSSLREKYDQPDRGIRINFLGNTFKLTTKKEHHEYYKKLIENPMTNTLSQAALETLAIIAYNQPMTRLKVDEVRGVGSSQMIRKLVAKGFLKEAGRSDLPGRPILYATTSEFLDFFGLATIDDLPSLDQFMETKPITSDEVDLYDSRYQESESDAI